MPSGMTRPCMFVVLGNELTLAKELRWPLQEVTVGDTTYQDAGFGNWTDFYDWLRSSDSTLLGVRYWLRDDLRFLGESVESRDYVKVEAGRQIEVYFSEERQVDETLSCDQEFLYDAVFRSSDGTYAIGFGMEGLTDADIEYLTKSGVRWATAQGITRDEP
jgi:hypothetical protein